MMGSWCRGMPRHQLTDPDPIEFPDLALHDRSDRLRPSHSLLLGTVIGAFPPTGVFFVTITDSIWAFIGMAFLAGAISMPRRISPALRFSAIALASAILVASRPNSLAVLAVLPLVGIAVHGPLRRWAVTFGVLVGAAAGLIAPGVMARTPSANPVSLGLAWEVVGVAKLTSDPILSHSLDRFGSTQLAIERYDPRALNGVFWDSDPPLPVARIAAPQAFPAIRGIFIKMVLDHPIAYARVKLGLVARVLGLRAPLMPVSYGFNFDDRSNPVAGARVNRANQALFGAFERIGNSPLSVARYPFVLILFGCGLFFIMLKRDQPFAFLIASGVAYYATFLVSCQAMEYRYYAPTYIVLLCAAAVTLASSKLMNGRPQESSYRNRTFQRGPSDDLAAH